MKSIFNNAASQFFYRRILNTEVEELKSLRLT